MHKVGAAGMLAERHPRFFFGGGVERSRFRSGRRSFSSLGFVDKTACAATIAFGCVPLLLCPGTQSGAPTGLRRASRRVVARGHTPQNPFSALNQPAMSPDTPTNLTGAILDFPDLTAAEIACAFGVYPQAMRKRLRAAPASGKRMVSGNVADTWNWSALPDAIRSRLAREAAKRGFATVGAWYRDGLKGWRPEVPLAEISDECLSAAAKLKEALLPSLRNPFVLTASDFEREGLRDYATVFGHRISGRHFRELIRRTVERDGGAENWEMLELYLPKKPARKPKATEATPTFPLLVQAINYNYPAETFGEDRMVPVNRADEIWMKVCETHAVMVKSGIPRKRAARQLRDFLLERAPDLAPSREALLKTFERRLRRWQAGEAFDQRAANGADDGEITQQIEAQPWFIPAAKYFELLSNRGRDVGSVPKAVMRAISLPSVPTGSSESIKRDLLKLLGMDELPSCPVELRETILTRRKKYQSLVPKKIAAKIRNPKAVHAMYRSSKRFSLDYLSAPGSQRRYFNKTTCQREKMAPGDWFGGDDATPGVAVCVPCNEVITPCSQKFGVLLGRFQWLAYLDGATDKILAFDYVVRPRGSYRAEDILNGMGAVLHTHGIPRQGWQFEGGTWNSNIVCEAIRQLGCEHFRTYSPHQKPIESVFNRVWTRLAVQFPNADMGRYRGENEENCALYESCKRGHKDPRRYFPTIDLVVKVFQKVIAEHNSNRIHSRQYGRWVPDEFFHGYLAENKLREFGPELDWILSPYAVERKVKGCMVKCQVPIFEDFSVPYEFSADWMPLHDGKLVRVHFNPRDPKCTAKIVLLENSGERMAGDFLGDAQLIGETASHIRLILGWANDNQQAGFIAKQQTANFLRRETRGVGVGGRFEYSKSEERDGLGQVAIAERGGSVPNPADDDKTRSRQRLALNMGTESPVPGRRPAESEAEIAELERRAKPIFD
jgi:hypothetical protein